MQFEQPGLDNSLHIDKVGRCGGKTPGGFETDLDASTRMNGRKIAERETLNEQWRKIGRKTKPKPERRKKQSKAKQSEEKSTKYTQTHNRPPIG